VPYEIEILWRLRGVAGVIKILEHFEEADRFIFVMEKIANSCTLFDFVMESVPLANTELLRHLIREIIRINITLQMYGVWHRDCKPENILYCKNDRSLYFIDFGSAAPVQSEDFREFQVSDDSNGHSLQMQRSDCAGHLGNNGTRMDFAATL
jgi:serine/threonine protein kinase